MLFFVLCVQVAVKVLSEAPPAPPQNIHVDKWNLTWTPATEEGPVNYTVQYRSFDSTVWRNVESCVQINWMYCHVESTKAEAEHGCVMLRVQAGRWGLTSDPAQVCNRHGDSCTPEISLTAQPGSLTVHLNRSHGLALKYGDHAIHRVYYGKEGEPLKEFKDTASSVSIDKLQEGQRYCTKVQYIYYNTLVGLASCTQCELIPESGNPPKQTGVIVAVVVVIVIIILSLMAVLLISLRGRIKRCLRPPYQIPQNLLGLLASPGLGAPLQMKQLESENHIEKMYSELPSSLISEPFLEHHNPICPSPSEERCDVISCISPDDLF